MKNMKKVLAVLLTLVMVLSLVLPASAANKLEEIGFEQIDNSAVKTDLSGRAVEDTTEAPQYSSSEIVRVSIVLEGASTIEAGYSTSGIAENAEAMAYRETLEQQQAKMEQKISREVLGGKKLDVVWNLTLAANIISANVAYGKIDEIKAIDGVEDVVIEQCYEPAVVGKNEADPDMATSSEMIGSGTAYLDGYTGAGMRIAIIDTGVDTKHRSFNAGAYEYSLAQNAKEKGMTTEEYIKSLDLLDVAEITAKMDKLNIGPFLAKEGISADQLYISSKIPFGFNYIDENLIIDHVHDKEGEHGSHVAGIATANAYVPEGEGYVNALEATFVQGVAPDAQLIPMKVFGKGGGAYDSDYMAAIEDAIVLGCDAINLSLGSGNPGSSYSVLSSATPGIESYSLAKKGIYSLEKLTERYGEAVLPEVTVIDMKAEKSRGNKYLISTELQNRLKSNLEAKKQSILLMNRRGYNTFVACDSCGSVVNCPYCSISMTFHLSNKKLMCHYCGYTTDFKTKCDVCGKENVRYSGYGTQRIEEELHNLLPEARILRMDTDSNSGRYAFEKNITAFGKNEYDIMLGTQMVAKGLDFENVTLVGVINADQQLNNDDFRSEELTFDLLTQVVGRCGRGKSKGTAVIQTMTPENNIIALAKRQDYEEFYKNEIAIRRMMTYPPFCDICAVYAVSEDELKALSAARVFLDEFKKRTENAENVPKVIVLPVMPPRIAKVNNKFRYRIIIKCKNTAAFRRIISDLLVEFGASRTFGDVTVFADINPLSLV